MGKGNKAKQEQRIEARAIGEAFNALEDKRLDPSFAVGKGVGGYACQKQLTPRIAGAPPAIIRGEGLSILGAISDFTGKVKAGAVIEQKPPPQSPAQQAASEMRTRKSGIVVVGR